MNSKRIKGYHYTNSRNYKSMQTKGIDGWYAFDFENFTGLIPRRRFLRVERGNKLPEKAHDAIIEGLLEPEPSYWLKNPEFPDLWKILMSDICRENEIMLLSFELNPKDEAYVVERAHIERELYKDPKCSTKGTMDEAAKKYWESRVPIFNYEGNYDLPQLAIWSGINFSRLKVEWVKSEKEVWEKVIKAA